MSSLKGEIGEQKDFFLERIDLKTEDFQVTIDMLYPISHRTIYICG